MRIERSTTSISWIPSDSIPGLLRFPFDGGIMHYDPPPPLTLTDVEGMRRRGEFRFANQLRAYIEVDDGQITGCGYTGGKVMGLTPVTAGPLRVMLPTKGNRDIQWQPAISANQATFVQTAGGRPGFSFLKPTWRWPFLVTKPFTIWTTLRLTIDVNGNCRQELIGASPFPRHWLYDDDGTLVQKSAFTRNQVWARTAFGSHTPWGGVRDRADVAEPETQLERTLAEQIMDRDEPSRFASCTPATSSSAKVSERRRSHSFWTVSSTYASTDRSSDRSARERSSANEHRSRRVAGRPTYAPRPTPAWPRCPRAASISKC